MYLASVVRAGSGALTLAMVDIVLTVHFRPFSVLEADLGDDDFARKIFRGPQNLTT